MKFWKFIKENLNKIILIIIYILVMYVLPDLLGNIFRDYIVTEEQALLYSCILNVVLYLLLLTSCLILLWNDIKKDTQIIKNTSAIRTFLIIIIGIVCAYALNYIGSMITSMITGPDGGNSMNENALRQMIASKYGLVLVPTIAFIGPIVEELVFRKALTSILRNLKINDWIIIVIVAILFGSIHVISEGDFEQIFPYVAMGLALGGVEKFAKNIYPSTAVHIFNNYVAVVIQIILGML